MSDMKLNQVVAVEKVVKGRCEAEVTKVYHTFQKPALFEGMTRSYTPKNEGGEPFPPETVKVQQRVEDLVATVAAQLTELFDTTATKDWGNCSAEADVVVDGAVLLSQVPSTFLL